jgi:hypothetical protein
MQVFLTVREALGHGTREDPNSTLGECQHALMGELRHGTAVLLRYHQLPQRSSTHSLTLLRLLCRYGSRWR